MHFTIAAIIPIIIAGISRNPIPSGISMIMRTSPIIAPIIVNNILNNTTPMLRAAAINIKNTKIPIKISILHLPLPLLYSFDIIIHTINSKLISAILKND